MGLDGFSMANMGLPNRLTSAQMANEVDAIVARGGESQVKGIDALGKRAGIERKEMDYRETGGQAFLNGDTSAGDEEATDSEEKIVDLPDVELDEDDPEHSPNRFQIKIDESTNTVELYDSYYEMTVQKVTTRELLSMVRHFNDSSGVLVNKKG